MIWGTDAVQALMAGRKTQFREIVPEGTRTAPHRPGDLVRVRESFNAYWGARFADGRIVFDADIAQADGTVSRATREEPIHVFYEADARPEGPGDWKPAATMPDWACRITLRVTGSRIERLHAITEADAEASGPETDIWDMALAVRDYSGPGKWYHMWGTHEGEPGYVPEERIFRESFRTLWERAHGPGSWDGNPLVAVTTFETADMGR